ncbi:MAG: hypothetical protein EAZ08_10635 [Cytophagales bacterium]|nr:MAG: hypothetical protein EAZ08_10635 [Cytophagales bacterium]
MKKHILFALLGAFLIIMNACKKSDTPPLPTANFTFAPENPTTQDEVVFTGTAQNAKTYTWSSSPTALSSTQLTARQRFTTAGTYQVTFTATGDGGSVPITKSITVVEAKPTVDFAFSVANPITRQPVAITTTVQNGTTFAWSSSPAGFTSSQQNPTFSFATAGNYTLTLQVTGAGGSTTVSKMITIAAPSLRADFTVSNPNPVAADVVTFTNRSTSDARTFAWTSTPEEGFSSTVQNPVFAFRSSGMKIVNLVVTDEFGNTANRSTSILVQRRLVGTLVALISSSESRGRLIATSASTSLSANSIFYLGNRDMPPFVSAGTVSCNGQVLARNAINNAYVNNSMVFNNPTISWAVSGSNDIPAINFDTNKPNPPMPDTTFPSFTNLDKTNGFTLQLANVIPCDELEVFIISTDANNVRISTVSKIFQPNTTSITFTGAELANVDDRFNFTITIEARNVSFTEVDGKSYVFRNVATRAFTYTK